MGHPMVPKITIAVRSKLRMALDAFPSRPMRRLAPCRFRQSVRQRFGPGSLCGVPFRHGRGSLPCPPRDAAPRRERLYAGLLPGRAATETSSPPRQPLRRCPARRAYPSATAQVHRSGASPGRAMCAAWTGSIARRNLRSCHGSQEPLRSLALYARHHGVTTKILLAALAAAAPQAALRPVTTGIPPAPSETRVAAATLCNAGR